MCSAICLLLGVPVEPIPVMRGYVYVHVCVWVSTAAREHSSNRVPACEDICACENSLREHFPDQLYTVGLGSGCPWKNLGKVLWNSVFYAVPFNASCKLLITAPITVTQLDGHARNYYLWRHRPSPTPTPVSTSSDSNVLAIITRAMLVSCGRKRKYLKKSPIAIKNDMQNIQI